MNLNKHNVKKFISLVMLVLMFFVGINYASARECTYLYEGYTIKIITSQEKNEETQTTSEVKIEYEIPSEIEYDKSYNFIDSSYFDNDEKCLSTITVCRFDKNQYEDWMKYALGLWINEAIYGERHIALFGSALDPSTIDDAIAYEFDDITDKSFWETWFWTGESESCTTSEYSGEDKANLKQNGGFVSYCDKFVSMYSDIASGYQDYSKCEANESYTTAEKSRCKANAITNINQSTDRLKETCNNILQNSNISVTDGCAQSCINTNEALNNLRRKYNLDANTTNECSMSNRLVIWLANIVRWIKYIIPVAVIILGILDFIKAIGADKEDEMKKAQGRFVKRLIAAALIFIIPFIIEFVLDKMGFDSNGCGIIDL